MGPLPFMAFTSNALRQTSGTFEEGPIRYVVTNLRIPVSAVPSTNRVSLSAFCLTIHRTHLELHVLKFNIAPWANDDDTVTANKG